MRGRTLPGDFATTGQSSKFNNNTMEELGTGSDGGREPSSNLAAKPDSYSMFQHLMEAKVTLSKGTQ